MSAAPHDRPDGPLDPRIVALLRAMRAVHEGDLTARAPFGAEPDEPRDEVAELCRLFNAIARRTQRAEEELERLRGDRAAEREDRAQAVEAAEGPGVEGERTPAVLVTETDPVGGPMGEAARTALRSLGAAWDRATVLYVGDAEAVRRAAARHRVVSVLLDTRAAPDLLGSVVAALEAEVPGVTLLCYAPDDDPVAADRARGIVRERSRAEIVRSPGQAVERLTLHWLTQAPGTGDLLAEPADPGYGQISFEGEKVLVVDDDVRNVFAMVSALELYGLNAITADNGPEAVDLLLRNPDIGIVLMDLMMPGLDGYATTARIRSYPEFANLPIIAVTARAAAGDRERSLAAGTDEHVTKPVDVDHLLGLIKRLIRR